MTIHAAVIQKLLSTNAHLGKRVVTHPMKPYIYGTRNSMGIIDSDRTLVSLRAALGFISELARNPRARFLFVNTNPLFDDIFDRMSQRLGLGQSGPARAQYWKQCGFLTNSASPKKFRSRNKRLCFGPVHPPDCVVVLDKEGKSSAVSEAARLRVPVVGLVDAAVPAEVFDRITYPIPCNDSAQFVYLVCNLITKTVLLERQGGPSGEEKLEEKNQSKDDTEVVSNLRLMPFLVTGYCSDGTSIV